MVIDTSVPVAILLDEPEREAFRHAIDASAARLVSAVTKLEASVVLMARRGSAAADELDRLLAAIAALVVPFDNHQADVARRALERYGKGRHKAALNLGDCAAYALAIAEAEPLLFKGTDFSATDVERVELGR